MITFKKFVESSMENLHTAKKMEMVKTLWLSLHASFAT